MRKSSFLILIVLGLALFDCSQQRDPRLVHISGLTMGTITYNVKYVSDKEHPSLAVDIEKVLTELNQSLSTYIPESEISKLNRESQLTYETEYFYPVLAASKKVFETTGGTFDPSIGPLVQAWGFGPNKEIPDLSQSEIDSLMSMVGFGKINFDEASVQQPVNHQLDFSAIAKGLAVDLIASLLKEKAIKNYMVEIGGEVSCAGVNREGRSWTLGIENPLVSKEERKLFAVARLKDRSLATSGNYRNYYEKNGQIFAHIIDPRTGRNAQHTLLSASVFATDCMIADAYATAFMVLGVEASMSIVDAQSDLDAILIFQNERGELESQISDGIRPFVQLINSN